ncbi:hypothetical protein [Parasporobacterium paucivorans]|uniref:Uncharacterized protein n=1 Tax=Parasporobacterium paucivorans DSM 15970 TaxID=1122934 RepID=A0A1M6IIG5_9FIRM|nr:hypothetical protein [Parasporobacterium paucivorans]SHJ34197.1 hypothetical protein SAMN02745691_01788 [Parasporobacterium paucivorans DSM 15970]
MKNDSTVTCRLYIPQKNHEKLNEEGREVFTKADDSSLYFTDFAAGFDGGSLYECIIAFCEVCLLTLNDVYGIKEDTDLKTEIFKLGQTDKTFSLLSTIKYAGNEKEYHEMLNFNRLEVRDDFFSFELLGDQSMFSLDFL